MNAMPPQQGWSWQRWVGMTTAVFMAQLLLIALLGARPKTQPTTTAEFQARLAEALMLDASDLPGFDDPVLFALPNWHGFSAHAWMRPEQIPHEYHEWSDAQRWLELRHSQMGDTFVQHVREISGQPLAMTEKPAAQFSLPDLEGRPDWLRTQSVIRVEGELVRRKLRDAPALVSWPYSEVLTPTRLLVWVNGRGRVVTAVPDGASGLAEADHYALQLAHDFLFEEQASAADAELTSGMVIIEWQTAPLTNAPSAPVTEGGKP